MQAAHKVALAAIVMTAIAATAFIVIPTQITGTVVGIVFALAIGGLFWDHVQT